MQVLPNRKCPAGTGHYTDAFLHTLSRPAYQADVRRQVKAGTANCGVPLHANDYVVFDIDCVSQNDGVDLVLLETVKGYLPRQDGHTYCVVSCLC